MFFQECYQKDCQEAFWQITTFQYSAPLKKPVFFYLSFYHGTDRCVYTQNIGMVTLNKRKKKFEKMLQDKLQIKQLEDQKYLWPFHKQMFKKGLKKVVLKQRSYLRESLKKINYKLIKKIFSLKTNIKIGFIHSTWTNKQTNDAQYIIWYICLLIFTFYWCIY